MMNEQFVYLVKFDLGYYARKQTHYSWSYTDDALLANPYKTLEKAVERGNYGLGLVQAFDNVDYPTSYTVERYLVKTVMEYLSTSSEVTRRQFKAD